MTRPGIPDHYTAVTPYLLVPRVGELIDFLSGAFGAKLHGRLTRPDGSVMHAELEIDGAMVMVGEPMGEFAALPGSVFLYVEDCDATYAKALEAGGSSVMEVATMEPAGVRYGGVKDGSGNVWWIATHLEDVSFEEEQYRIDAVAGQEFGE